MTALLQRRYNVGDELDAAVISVEEPILTERDWRCSYSIEIGGELTKSDVSGVDKLQSLTLALRKLAAELIYLSEECGYRLTWMGDSRLDLI